LITIRSNNTFFLSSLLLLPLDFHGGARVLAAEASLGRYRVVPIPRPIEDSGAILLPGKTTRYRRRGRILKDLKMRLGLPEQSLSGMFPRQALHPFFLTPPKPLAQP
jgi:hypothetical protein